MAPFYEVEYFLGSKVSEKRLKKGDEVVFDDYQKSVFQGGSSVEGWSQITIKIVRDTVARVSVPYWDQREVDLSRGTSRLGRLLDRDRQTIDKFNKTGVAKRQNIVVSGQKRTVKEIEWRPE